MSYPPAEHRQPDDDHPTTARPPSSAGAGYYYEHHDPQYTYSEEPIDEEDEEDESEEEDVFAYLPPTTAQIQEQQQHQQQFAYAFDPPSDRPQTKHGEMSVHHAHTDSYPSSIPPVTPFSNIPVETPPSTESQSDPHDPYRLRRLSLYTPPTTGTGARLSVSRSGAGARGVRVELPPTTAAESELADNEKSFDLGEQSTHGGSFSLKERPMSTDSATASMSVTPSMLEYADVESRESIK